MVVCCKFMVVKHVTAVPVRETITTAKEKATKNKELVIFKRNKYEKQKEYK